jgi:hypothetical protein
MKFRIFFFLMIFTVFYSTTFAQNDFTFPNGVYLTHEQFKNRTPAFSADFRTILRSSGDVFLSGGNPYKFESKNDSLDKDFIKKEIYAYVKNDSVFINCKHHKLQSWYTLALTKGNFIVFYSAVSTGKMIRNATLVSAGGAIGGAISGGNYDYHVLSLRTGNARELNKEYMKGRLKEYPDLLVAYEGEKKQNTIEVLLKYIDKLNAITDPLSEVPYIQK